jgi:hypothetical protein
MHPTFWEVALAVLVVGVVIVAVLTLVIVASDGDYHWGIRLVCGVGLFFAVTAFFYGLSLISDNAKACVQTTDHQAVCGKQIK